MELFLPETIKERSAKFTLHILESFSNVIKAFTNTGIKNITPSTFLFNAGFTFFTTFFAVFLAVRFGFSQGNTGDYFAAYQLSLQIGLYSLKIYLIGNVGYRTRTLGGAIWANKNLDKLDPEVIRKYAIDNFSMDRIKYLYKAYFEQLNTLWDKGWYSEWDNGVSKYNRHTRYLS